MPQKPSPNRRIRVETWIIVSIITALIWLLAEGRTVQTHDSVIQVQLVAPAGQEQVVEPTTAQQVKMLYRCAAAQKAQIESRQDPLKIEITADPEQPRQDINLRNRLLADTIIGELGVEIIRLDPERLQVRAERLEPIEVPVTVNTGSLQLAGPPQVEPGTATVTVPTSLTQRARRVQMVADLAALDHQGIEPGIEYTREVPLTLPASLRGHHSSFTPRVATVVFQVQATEQTYTIPTVPVLMVAPPTEMSRFSVQLADEDRVIRDITVSGPSDEIERIRKGEVDVWARFRLTASDLDAGVDSAPVTLDLPPGVSVEKALPRVSVTITRIEPTAPPAP